MLVKYVPATGYSQGSTETQRHQVQRRVLNSGQCIMYGFQWGKGFDNHKSPILLRFPSFFARELLILQGGKQIRYGMPIKDSANLYTYKSWSLGKDDLDGSSNFPQDHCSDNSTVHSRSLCQSTT